MENLPERSRDIRASDADREHVVELLGQALADGRLDTEEHSERLDQVYQAKTMGELEPITYDLPATHDRPHTAPASSVSKLVDSRNPSGDTDQMIGIFGGGTRKGRWRVRRKTRMICIFGGFDIDMTEATFEAREVEIQVFALFGGCDVKVPEGVELRDSTGGVFGGFEVRTDDDPVPGGPVITVRGVGIFGGGSFKTVRRRRSKEIDH
jgi:hypothetical protein